MPRKNLLLTWIALAVMASLSVYLASAPLGAGVGEDGAKYLSAAQNLADGRGLFMYNNEPMTQWPPGYPAVLALGARLGVDVYIFGWWLNLLLFGLIVLGSGVLVWRALGEHSLLSYAGAALVLTSVALMAAVVNISSDPLFLLVVLAFLLTSENYLRKPSAAGLGWLAFWVICSTLLRYVGLGLVAAGALVVFATPGITLRQRFVRSVAFGILTVLPIMAWGYLRNYALAGTLFGPRQWASPLLNVLLIVDKVVSWFVPRLLLSRVPALAVAALVVAGLLALSTPASRAAFRRVLLSPAVLPSAAFVLGYVVILARASSFFEFQVEGFDRVHVILLPSLLVLGFVAAVHLPVRLHAWLSARQRGWLAGLVLLGLLAFTGFRTQKYLLSVAQQGYTMYNFANSLRLHESALAHYLMTSPELAQTSLYSNNEAALWLYVRQDIRRVPRLGDEGDWPHGEQGYLVWFLGDLDYKYNLIDPADYVRAGWLQIVFEDEVGLVYKLTPQGQ